MPRLETALLPWDLLCSPGTFFAPLGESHWKGTDMYVCQPAEMDIATTRPKRPKGRFGEKSDVSKTNKQKIKKYFWLRDKDNIVLPLQPAKSCKSTSPESLKMTVPSPSRFCRSKKFPKTREFYIKKITTNMCLSRLLILFIFICLFFVTRQPSG